MISAGTASATIGICAGHTSGTPDTRVTTSAAGTTVQGRRVAVRAIATDTTASGIATAATGAIGTSGRDACISAGSAVATIARVTARSAGHRARGTVTAGTGIATESTVTGGA